MLHTIVRSPSCFALFSSTSLARSSESAISKKELRRISTSPRYVSDPSGRTSLIERTGQPETSVLLLSPCESNSSRTRSVFALLLVINSTAYVHIGVTSDAYLFRHDRRWRNAAHGGTRRGKARHLTNDIFLDHSGERHKQQCRKFEGELFEYWNVD